MPLHLACQWGYAEIAASLVEVGADTRTFIPGSYNHAIRTSPLYKRFEQIWCNTPLSVALYDNSIDIFRDLLEEKNDTGHHTQDPNWTSATAGRWCMYTLYTYLVLARGLLLG